MKKFIVASRPSLLAYTQTELVVGLLKKMNPDCEFIIKTYKTQGDEITHKPLSSFGGTGVFVKELENALLHNEAHFAVHSLKDVPSNQPPGLALVSFPQRNDANDIILTKNNVSINDLPPNCIIGTCSTRRIIQLKVLKPNAVFKNIRGNIDTRLNKLNNGEYDAIVLAAAGLLRIGKTIPNEAYLPINTCIPAVGQGTLVLECQKQNTELINILRTINDTNTEIASTAERSFMKTIGGGCKFPLGAYATINNDTIQLFAIIGNHNTGKFVKLFEESIVYNAYDLGVNTALKIIEECRKQNITIEI